MAALAARQHGVISRAQLVALGFARHVIARHIEPERLHRLHRGVYAVGHRALNPRATGSRPSWPAERARC